MTENFGGKEDAEEYHLRIYFGMPGKTKPIQAMDNEKRVEKGKDFLP